MSVLRIVFLEVSRFLFFVGAVSLVFSFGFLFGVVSVSFSLVSSVLFVSFVFYILEFVFDVVA